ncbi:50S ribosomal protein L30e-like protein [Echria macrotheca]|uniref:50S ribosomal protein L30e-like protein n=1 Tax=Echria macrotheca TaxID=438768 RepID=A0AAJ0B3L6_9PEZI|nr:50S ribosomal protein L30e-like protein [Echria macrotheca]
MPALKPTAEDALLIQHILDTITIALHHKQLKIGITDVTKSIFNGSAELVILAADAYPPHLVRNLSVVAENHGIPHVFLPSKIAMGNACHLNNRAVIAVSITANLASPLHPRIRALLQEVERLAREQHR